MHLPSSRLTQQHYPKKNTRLVASAVSVDVSAADLSFSFSFFFLLGFFDDGFVAVFWLVSISTVSYIPLELFVTESKKRNQLLRIALCHLQIFHIFVSIKGANAEAHHTFEGQTMLLSESCKLRKEREYPRNNTKLAQWSGKLVRKITYKKSC